MKKELNGAELAEYIKERQARAVRGLRQENKIQPKLAIVRTNPDKVVDSYMRIKQRYGEDVLVDVDVHTIEQSEALELISKLNSDASVHGIIVQIPLPDPSQTEEILNAVALEKDVDGLRDPEAPWPMHGDAMQGDSEESEQDVQRVRRVSTGDDDAAVRSKSSSAASSAGRQAETVHGSGFDAPTPMAINWLLVGYNIELSGKNLAIVGHGRLVGKPLAKLWTNSGLKFSVIDKSTPQIARSLQSADVIVSATGVPALITSDMVKSDAVIVDAGVATDSNGLVGDVSQDVREMSGITITPIKGGVGPLTVAALFENVITAARKSATSK